LRAPTATLDDRAVVRARAAAMEDDSEEVVAWLNAARAGDLFTIKRLYSAASDPAALSAASTARENMDPVQTACHWLAAGGHLASLRWISTLPNAQQLLAQLNEDGATPLHVAASYGHHGCVEALLAAGADPTTLTATGESAFDCAASGGHDHAAWHLAAHAPPHAFMKLSIDGRRAGSLLFRLDEPVAPRACANFLGLCEGFRATNRVPGALYGRDGALAPSKTSFFGYRGSVFHRLLPGQLLQGGRLPGGDLSVFGPHFDDESSGLRVAQGARGLLCMANSGPDTNASQFYITLGECTHLTGAHVCFGRLVRGAAADATLAAAEAVPLTPSAACLPSQQIVITSCGRWPPAPPTEAASAGGTASQATTSLTLSEVDDRAHTSRLAVAAAVAAALGSTRSKRQLHDDDETCGGHAAAPAPKRSIHEGSPRTGGLAAAFDPLAGLEGSSSSGDESCSGRDTHVGDTSCGP
jgi:cyclophilin family peptidyl-prolyl cis-trans isomerase